MQFLLQESGAYGPGAASSPDTKLLNGGTAAFLAAQAGNLAVLQHLVQAGADTTVLRKDGASCLFVRWAISLLVAPAQSSRRGPLSLLSAAAVPCS